MQIEQGKSLADQVRQELAELAESTSSTTYMTQAAECVEKWLQFIDEIQRQRDGLIQLRDSLSYATSFIYNGKMKLGLTPSSETLHERVIRPHGRSDTSARIRDAAMRVFNEDKAWRTTGALMAHIRRLDSTLDDVESSLVSAAMDYGRKKGIFGARYEGSSKVWGLQEWLANEDRQETGD